MTHDAQPMTEDQFFERYRPRPSPGTDPDSGEYRQDEAAIAGADPRTVWTVIEGDTGGLYAAAGRHRVNRIDYLLTEVPWATGEELACLVEPEEGQG